jgi:hypothetical protein
MEAIVAAESPLSSKHNRLVVISSHKWRPVLEPLKQLFDGTIMRDEGPSKTRIFRTEDGLVKAAREPGDTVTVVTLEQVGDNPNQAARWAAVHMFAQKLGRASFRGLVLGPFDSRDNGSMERHIYIDRLRGMPQEIRTMYPEGTEPDQVYLSIGAPTLGGALNSVIDHYDYLLPHWPGPTGETAANIVGAANASTMTYAFRVAEQQHAPLLAARALYEGLQPRRIEQLPPDFSE